MSTTLTNGLKLPDKGSVDWYADMQSNYTILDGAVGTVAEHTAALAGKAPLVHTHTVSQITDFPAYGNAAGTICEGNDSRLSDARTPVAHTHTKSDVTDLLNSNFIPSANNSYDLGSSSYQWNKIYSADVVHTSGNETITGVKTFSNSLSINGSSPRLQTKSTTYSSATSSGMTIGDIAFLNKDGGFSAWIVHQLRDDLTKRLCFRVYPHTSTTYRGFVFDDTCTLYPENGNSALGSSSYQWNNIYAKNYYYNGTAWGLDQANVWNTYQTIKGYYFGNEQSTNGRTCLYLTSNRDTVGQSGIYITKFRQNRAQGAMGPADLQFISFDILENSIRTNGVLQLNITNWNEDGNVPSGAVLFSNLSNAHLGSSLIPWKTLNGVNPGALSLPGNSSGINTDNWDKTGASANSYTPAVDGWLVLRCADVAGDYLFASWSGAVMRASVTGQGLITLPAAGLCLYIPVKAGTTVDCVVKATNKFGAFIYPCLGNV